MSACTAPKSEFQAPHETTGTKRGAGEREEADDTARGSQRITTTCSGDPSGQSSNWINLPPPAADIWIFGSSMPGAQGGAALLRPAPRGTPSTGARGGACATAHTTWDGRSMCPPCAPSPPPRVGGGCKDGLAGVGSRTDVHKAHGGPTQGPWRATPLRRALGIIPTANKAGNSMLLYFLLFHTPPLYTRQYAPSGLFFLF